MAFSVWMQMNTVIEGMRGRVADLVIGRYLGSHPLAIFNMSNELASLPQAEFVGALNSAVFPKYARLQDDVSQLRAAYLDILSLTLLVGLPVACGLAFVAPSAVRVLLGPAWAETAPVIQIIAFGAFANAVAANTAFVLLTAGRPNLNTCLSGLTLAALVALLVWMTATHGIKGAATAFTLTAFAALPIHLLVLRRLIGVRLRDIAPRAWRSLLAAALMCLALWPVVPDVPPHSLPGALYALLMGMAVGCSVYIAAISALWVASGRPASTERLLMTTAIDIAVRVDARLLGSRLARRT
jgi:O-antigen/teichoic acid export membrane protein